MIKTMQEPNSSSLYEGAFVYPPGYLRVFLVGPPNPPRYQKSFKITASMLKRFHRRNNQNWYARQRVKELLGLSNH